MTDQYFNDPVQPGTFKPEEWNGHLLMIEAFRYLDNVQTKFGPSDAVEGRVTVLTAQGGPHVVEQARLFGNLAGSLRPTIGQKPTLGRLGQVMTGNANPAWVLTPASAEDRAYAQQYLLSRPSTQSPAPVPVGPGPMANAYPQQYALAPPMPAQVAPPAPPVPPAPQGYAPPQGSTAVAYPPPAPPTSTITYNQAATTTANAYGPPPNPVPTTPQPPVQAPPRVPAPAITPAAPAAALTPEQIASMPPEVQALLLGQAAPAAPRA